MSRGILKEKKIGLVARLLIVSIKSSNVIRLISQRSFPFQLVNLFSDFGGNIGLWIGFSVITFAEFFELFCEVTRVLYKLKQ